MISATVFNSKLSTSWAEFVNCPKRLKTLGQFLNRVLYKYKNGIILDAALGIGCESIFLKALGYNVISNEIDMTLIEHAMLAAKSQNIHLDVFTFDWRDFDVNFSSDAFDAVLLLGNSLCLLETKEEIIKSVDNIYKILKPGGLLIVDERNFPYILGNRSDILRGDFRYSGNYMYCGNSIKGIPTSVSSKEIIFSYFRDNIVLGTLKMYPFIHDELKSILNNAGLKNIKQFSDFQSGYFETADFFLYISTK